MADDRDDDAESHEAAGCAVAKGHGNIENLRELLIWTTSSSTEPLVSSYFRKHLSDRKLLSDLINIALEGEDAGDAPWAAANVITMFPPELLEAHRAELETLSREQWDYLNVPAKEALAKLSAL
nr:hypothetical protein [uncultured Hyphomonas sp.]